jgi:PLP dependent protein
MIIEHNFLRIRLSLHRDVNIVAVSKNRDVNSIMEAYSAGQRVFGENRVQELLEKMPHLPDDISWHMIGHLQTNKVKAILPYIGIIHSIDSLKLLQTVDMESAKLGKITSCLLQMYIAKEESKHGLSEEELQEILSLYFAGKLKNICIRGLMGMATFSQDENLVRSEFRYLANIFRTLKEGLFKDDENFSFLSMGMSSDYLIAIQEGANVVRLGAAIFEDNP